MADNLLNEGPGDNTPVFTVSELSQALKRTVEDTFAWVRVRGEISGFKRAASGHLYFSLKDERAVLDAVCWRGTANRLGLRPEDGMEVVATGRLTTYPARSRYQIVVESLDLAGEGALLKLLEARKKKLAAEGLFAEERKKPIPFLPDVIGVVTSPTGAVIRDILHRLDDRFPRHVVLWPVVVQGEGAAEQVARAIEGFNRLDRGGPVPRPDVLIVARGGGSLEDLWAFNEEVAVRAAAESVIPLIAAVGHETDVTLIDFAADLRAPTPTAAAEMAVPVRTELLAQVMDDGTRLMSATGRLVDERRARLEGLVRGLPNLRRLSEEAAQRLDDWTERLRNGLGAGLERRRARLGELAAGLVRPDRLVAHARSRLDGQAKAMRLATRTLLKEGRTRLAHAARLLESSSYQRVLERGFALVRDEAGRRVDSVKVLAPGMALALRFHDGEAGVAVTRTKGGGGPSRGGGKGRRGANDRQGSLL